MSKKLSKLNSIGFRQVITGIEFSDFTTAIQENIGELVLDITALTERAYWNTFLGDRTISKNIKRCSWFNDCSYGDGSDLKIPEHGLNRENAFSISSELFKLIKNEIDSYIVDKQNIGILLSGGMDSRIVAGILKKLQDRDEFKVTVFCWGDINSRDPIYARRIAKLYNWEFTHFDITPQVLKRNISISAEMGCFFAPQHLHAMEDIAKKAASVNIDCILAGSYGDSIGRGEYSSKKVVSLKPIKSWLGDPFKIINRNLHKESYMNTLAEINKFHRMYGDNENWVVNELDYQLHYMRNQLNTCMSVINKYVPLYQCFTALDVVEYMWSFHPNCRTDEVYYHLIKKIDEKLYEIPWARTGKRYLNENDSSDNIRKSYHNYSSWLRGELSEYIENLIFDGAIEETGIFNMKQLKHVYFFNKNNKWMGGKRVDEIVFFLASLSIFLSSNTWKIDSQIYHDTGRSLVGTAYLKLYGLNQWLKNKK